jgi:molybdopterin-binding protein
MKISARNVLKGKVKSLAKGAVTSEVTLQVAPGVEIVATITRESVKSLGLKKGMVAYAIIKASSVMVGVPHAKR